MLERAHEPRKLISGAPQERERVEDEAGHDAGMSAQHEHKAYEDQPANSAHTSPTLTDKDCRNPYPQRGQISHRIFR
jgi:hypothetical protein